MNDILTNKSKIPDLETLYGQNKVPDLEMIGKHGSEIPDLKMLGKRELCNDCISRQAAIDAFERFIHELGIVDEPYNYGEMALSTKNVPSVIPQPKIGHWIPIVDRWGDTVTTINGYKCSECNTFNINKDNYCPDCGAKMEGKE